MITSLTLDGTTIDPRTVAADMTVLHGRKSVRDSITPASATVMVMSASMPTWAMGHALALDGDTGPMFRGRVTDRALEHWVHADGTSTAIFTLTAAGVAADLGRRSVGDEPWPAEPGSARAARILLAAGVPFLVDGPDDHMVLARDVDSATAGDLLADLAASTGAAVVDMPDGTVIYQPMRQRSRAVRPYRWQDFPPDGTWADIDTPAVGMPTWADFASLVSGDSEYPLDVPPGAVQWEPQWSTTETAITNHIRVGYGPTPENSEQPWIAGRDQPSIAEHGERYRYQATQLADQLGAMDYVSWVLATQAQPHWTFPDMTVHLGLLDDDTRAAVLALTCGDHVRVAGMPQPAPASTGEAIVEGWTFTQWGVSGQLTETITLHTSSLLESLAVPQWSDVDPAATWATVDAALTWSDLTDMPAMGV